MDVYEKAALKIKNSKYTVMLTGAGISTDSGIPDFRSPGKGLWTKMDPMKALSTDVLLDAPQEFYSSGFELLISMGDSKPNKAHYLVTELEKRGLLQLLITQNIDNLHLKAGTKNVYEVHGNTRTCTCMSCGESFDIERVIRKVESGEIPPRCTCAGIIRPDVVLFGDMLPQCFYDGYDCVVKADLLIVAGTSLTVSPVNYLAEICKSLIIINKSNTPFDYRSDVIIHEGISEALEKIINCM